MKKDVIIYFIGKMIPALVNLAIIVLGVRFLGEEQYGKSSLIFSGVILISNFSFTWIQQSMVRFLSAFKEQPSGSISRFFFLTIASTLAGTIALLLSSVFYLLGGIPCFFPYEDHFFRLSGDISGYRNFDLLKNIRNIAFQDINQRFKQLRTYSMRAFSNYTGYMCWGYFVPIFF